MTRWKLFSVVLMLSVSLVLTLCARASPAPPAVNLDQLRNGRATAPVSPGDWSNGNLGSQQAHYVEGHSVAYRAVLTDLPTGTSITLTLGYDIKHSGRHALDYLTHYNRIDNPDHNTIYGHVPEIIDPLAGVAGVSSTTTTFAIPAPSSVGSPVPNQPTNSFNSLPAGERVMTLFGGTITGVSYVSQGSLTASQAETQISVTFSADSSTAVLAWGGHIASRTDWGLDAGGDPRSAGGISGSPYHMRLIDWTLDNIGQQDRSLSAVAVYAPMDTGTIIVYKDAIPDDSQMFEFTSTTLSPSPFYLDDDGVGDCCIIFSDLAAGTYDVTEAVPPAWWDLTNIIIVDPSGGSSSSGYTANIDLATNETVTVIFTNKGHGNITVVKNAIPDDPQDFSFSGDLGAFTLDDDADPPYSNTKIFSNLDAGSYDVTETVPTGWDLTSVTFTGDTDGGSSSSISTATIDLDPGEEINVTFTDERAQCTVDFYTDPSTVGSVTFMSTEYVNGNSDTFTYGTSGQVTANVPTGYTFSHWVVSGNVAVGSTTDNPTTFTVTCGGSLTAVFTQIQCTVEFYTDPSTVGTISFESGTYSNGDSDTFAYRTSGLATANVPVGYVFDHWVVSGNVAVSSTTANPTTVTVACGGTLKAVFRKPPPVGGVWVPIDKTALLAPWIGSALLIVGAVLSITYVKNRKKH